MLSSRMRTVLGSGCRGGGVSQHALCRGVCIPACTGQGVSAQGGVYLRGCLPGGVCPGSVCVSQHALSRGVSAPVHAGIHSSPWTEFLTHACENITFSQLLLWTVINTSSLPAFVGICLIIISEWSPLSHRLLLFW